ncbi:valacyclovir hydrolase [Euwallacea similis]|uniref:valacyclovir hydrolase n=1 Tax=Euwallacea similis TaxID=1736056 RepID=UPI00344DF099
MHIIKENFAVKKFKLFSKLTPQASDSTINHQLNLHLKRTSYSTLHKSTQTKVGNQIINYVKIGNGPKTVLCFPGALGSIWSDFKPQIEGLDKNHFTIIAWDPPGYGLSRPPNRKFDQRFYDRDADCAYHFMKSIGIAKYSLLGWSDGGISSLILTAKYNTVEKLVVWGANAFVTSDDIALYEKIRDLSAWSEKMKNPLIKLYTEKGLTVMWNEWCDTMIKIYENGGNICNVSLKNITCPTLILHGDKDPLVPEGHPLHLQENIKGSKLHRYPQGKHNIHLKYADGFNKIVSEFLLDK